VAFGVIAGDIAGEVGKLKPAHDWEPDLDNGSSGQIILQSMLMQARGGRIQIFPAWPKTWDVDFRLHAAHDTAVSGIVRGGRVVQVVVTADSRLKDVVQMALQ
jgi:hypothetical protein